MDKGLISYNDIEFTNFNETNSPLPDNSINCITVDNVNKIWIGTNLGIAVFDANNWIIYNRIIPAYHLK
ncbi:MAG: hypothetical protein IH950_03335 [Bacteroidetes bacterium]|nr:hypothetical protein [Bacteroidota bacterium]